MSDASPLLAARGEMVVFGTGPLSQPSFSCITGPFIALADLPASLLVDYADSLVADTPDDMGAATAVANKRARALVAEARQQPEAEPLLGAGFGDPAAAGFVAWLEARGLVQRQVARLVTVCSSTRSVHPVELFSHDRDGGDVVAKASQGATVGAARRR